MVDTLFTHDPEQPYNLYAPPGIPKFFAAADQDSSPPDQLDFHVIIANSTDSVPAWSNHPLIFHAPISVSLAFMMEKLRDYLHRERLRRDPPPPRPANQKGKSLANFFTRGPRRPLPPRVAVARVYLTVGPNGNVEPVERKHPKKGEDFDVGWRFTNCIAKMDITARLESEWRILRELIIASRGQLKCFIVTQGHKV